MNIPIFKKMLFYKGPFFLVKGFNTSMHEIYSCVCVFVITTVIYVYKKYDFYHIWVNELILLNEMS